MRETARQAEHGTEGKAIAGAEEDPVGDRACQGPQGSMLAAQEIVGEIQRSEHVQRTAEDADQRECVLIHIGRTWLCKGHGLAIAEHQE
jgi:hypothetical protein